MRTLVICHEDAPLDRDGLVRWLGSFTDVAGTVVIREPGRRMRRRIRRELARVGWRRFADVVAFRVFHRVVHRRNDRRWEAQQLEALRARFPRRPDGPELVVASPNSSEAEHFIRQQRPDLVVARCKTILREGVFTLPRLGTFVMHPGICPEYRNAHGCFWAIAAGDLDNVGMTLLKIDRGVDTGPVFGYFRIRPDRRESHVITQHRVVFSHLDRLRDLLLDIEAGRAVPIDTAGRRSAAWGQPWLTAHLRARFRGVSSPSHPPDSSWTSDQQPAARQTP